MRKTKAAPPPIPYCICRMLIGARYTLQGGSVPLNANDYKSFKLGPYSVQERELAGLAGTNFVVGQPFINYRVKYFCSVLQGKGIISTVSHCHWA